MIILKSIIVGVITFVFFLIIAQGDIIYDKLTKNKYIDKAVTIAVNLFFYCHFVIWILLNWASSL